MWCRPDDVITEPDKLLAAIIQGSRAVAACVVLLTNDQAAVFNPILEACDKAKFGGRSEKAKSTTWVVMTNPKYGELTPLPRIIQSATEQKPGAPIYSDGALADGKLAYLPSTFNTNRPRHQTWEELIRAYEDLRSSWSALFEKDPYDPYGAKRYLDMSLFEYYGSAPPFASEEAYRAWYREAAVSAVDRAEEHGMGVAALNQEQYPLQQILLQRGWKRTLNGVPNPGHSNESRIFVYVWADEPRYDVVETEAAA
jgi:hypothetical protein